MAQAVIATKQSTKNILWHLINPGGIYLNGFPVHMSGMWIKKRQSAETCQMKIPSTDSQQLKASLFFSKSSLFSSLLISRKKSILVQKDLSSICLSEVQVGCTGLRVRYQTWAGLARVLFTGYKTVSVVFRNSPSVSSPLFSMSMHSWPQIFFLPLNLRQGFSAESSTWMTGGSLEVRV